jgi:hypothetical protein
MTKNNFHHPKGKKTFCRFSLSSPNTTDLSLSPQKKNTNPKGRKRSKRKTDEMIVNSSVYQKLCEETENGRFSLFIHKRKIKPAEMLECGMRL